MNKNRIRDHEHGWIDREFLREGATRLPKELPQSPVIGKAMGAVGVSSG